MHFVHNETDIIDKTVVEILRHMIKRFDRATSCNVHAYNIFFKNPCKIRHNQRKLILMNLFSLLIVHTHLKQQMQYL